MICIDNSEWMRNGDYSPSRFQAQSDAVNLICGAKTQVRNISVFFFSFQLFIICLVSGKIWAKKGKVGILFAAGLRLQ